MEKDSSLLVKSTMLQSFFKENRFAIIDAGARGVLPDSWGTIDPELIEVYGFEPDVKEAERLNEKKQTYGEYFPIGLWSGEKELDFHYALDPSTSSIYPPNFEKLKKYPDRNWKCRITQEIRKVKCNSIDNILKEKDNNYDFLKIDVHSAEYEILQGAVNILKDRTFCVQVEAWTVEAHKGQYLAGDIITLMKNLGFSLFDIDSSYVAWSRKHSDLLQKKGKRQVVGVVLLFFKDNYYEGFSGIQLESAIKAAAIAELYDFPDLGLEIIDNAIKAYPGEKIFLQQIRKNLIDNWKQEEKMKYSFRQKAIMRIQNYSNRVFNYLKK